jgi:hypothetical protein
MDRAYGCGQPRTPEQAATFLASETKRWGDVINAAKIPKH